MKYMNVKETSIARAGLDWVLPLVAEVVGKGRVAYGTNDVCAVFVVDKDAVEPRAGKRLEVVQMLRDMQVYGEIVDFLSEGKPNPEVVPYLVFGPNSVHAGWIHVANDSASNKEVRLLS